MPLYPTPSPQIDFERIDAVEGWQQAMDGFKMNTKSALKYLNVSNNKIKDKPITTLAQGLLRARHYTIN